jgi:hypothetical protein
MLRIGVVDYINVRDPVLTLSYPVSEEVANAARFGWTLTKEFTLLVLEFATLADKSQGLIAGLVGVLGS